MPILTLTFLVQQAITTMLEVFFSFIVYYKCNCVFLTF